mmetsp:Transcript_3818/g.5787  ORF Transcript_3818/g.5787 Transcript_3818/m.5787 type:complete len:257 (-) Transcript_3818:1233-2003(-)
MDETSALLESFPRKEAGILNADSTGDESDTLAQKVASFENGSSAPSAREVRRKNIASSIIDFAKSKSIFAAECDVEVDDIGNETDEWPDLYNLTWSMVDASLVIYQLIMIRKLMREGKISCPEVTVDSPLTLKIAQSLIDKHRKILKKYMGKTDTDHFARAVGNAKARVEKEGGTIQDSQLITQFYAIDDEDHNLVYGIGVNSCHRRVVVSFRGTKTFSDVLTDLDFIKMKAMPNPLSNYEGQPDQIGMHSGFHSK